MHKTNCCGKDLFYDFSKIKNGNLVRCRVDRREGVAEVRNQCDGSGNEFQLLFVVYDDGTEDCVYPHQLERVH